MLSVGHQISLSLKQREVVLHIKERQILERLAKGCCECKYMQEETGLHFKERYLGYYYSLDRLQGLRQSLGLTSSWGSGDCWRELLYMLALFLLFLGYPLMAPVGEQ